MCKKFCTNDERCVDEPTNILFQIAEGREASRIMFVPSLAQCEKKVLMKAPKIKAAHFFLPPLSASVFLSQEMTLPSITTPLPSMKATRDKPSQFLKVSQTSGCCG